MQRNLFKIFGKSQRNLWEILKRFLENFFKIYGKSQEKFSKNLCIILEKFLENWREFFWKILKNLWKICFPVFRKILYKFIHRESYINL